MTLKQMLGLSILFHFLAVIYSVGFFNFDEHFQVVEFANLKLGQINGSDLPWEFQERARSFFQPAVYYSIIKILQLKNPFVASFLFRLVNATFAFLTAGYFFIATKKWFKTDQDQKLSFVILFLLWFLPFSHVRTSSENFGISFFIWALGLFILKIEDSPKAKWACLFTGLLLGLSFESRFQMAFMILGFGCWAIYYRKVNVPQSLIIAVGLLIAKALGFLIDSWGYGQWTFTLWDYFRVNFIDGALVNGGVDPWWDYFRSTALILPPLSSVLLVLTLVGFWIKKDHLITWVSLPFLIFHILVGHKEIRYLIPIFTIAPLVSIYVLNQFTPLQHYLSKGWAVKVALFINFVTLLNLSVSPAKRQLALYQFAYETSQNFKYVVLGEDPFFPSGLRPWFYTKTTTQVKSLNSIDDLPQVISQENKIYLVAEARGQATPEHCDEVWNNLPFGIKNPELITKLNRFKVKSWVVYDCHGKI